MAIEESFFDGFGVALPVYGQLEIRSYFVRGVIPKTSPNRTESVPVVAFSALATPTIAMSRPVPIGQTLWKHYAPL